MKKGFTMIELIFVIVILGILASVAIPRLAGTRQDAEITAAAANLRTLVSDAGAYYAVKNKFGTGDASIKWSELTNVPLNNPNGAAIGSDGILKVGGKDCIAVRVQNREGNVPAHILFLKKSGGAACTKVQNSEPIKAYFDSRVAGVDGLGDNKGAIPIGSSISIYGPLASAAGSRPGGGATAPIGSKPAVATPATVASAVASTAGSRPGAQATAATGSKPAAQSTPAAVLAAVASASQPEAPKPPRVTETLKNPPILPILGAQTGNQKEVNEAYYAQLKKRQEEATKEWIASGQRDKDIAGHKEGLAAAKQRIEQQAAATKEWEKEKKEKDKALFTETLKQIQAGGSATGSKPGGYFSTANGKGQVTQGTGTGSTGHALPAWFRR